jgi:fumarate hydratase, class II
MTEEATRLETDSMGEVAVPASAKWGATTQRAVENFPISGQRMDPAVIHALGRIKAAAASVNAQLGVLPPEVAAAIRAAADEVAAGGWDEEFPIDVFQTGSGTSSNMNANEVIATLAGEQFGQPVHPNDHVNASQSSNDVIPSAIHLAAADRVVNELIPALTELAEALEAKAGEFAAVVKSGRTHLMDATPVTLGQEFGGYAAQVRYGIERLEATLPRVGELALGGTAVGTGINAPAGFAAAVIGELRETTGLPLTEARNHFEAQGAQDGLVELSGQLRTIAIGLYKIATDIRWMGSGPRAGLAEIHVPDLQPGSSIMPGKVNPVIPEAVAMVCAQVMVNDVTITLGGQAGNFQLNVMLPVIAYNLLQSIGLLSRAASLLADKAIAGFTVNRARTADLVDRNPIMVTALNPVTGYETGARIAKRAYAEGRTVKDVAAEMTQLTPGELDRLLNPRTMTDGGIFK